MKFCLVASVFLILGMSMMTEAERARRQVSDAFGMPHLRCDVECGKKCSLDCSRGVLRLCCFGRGGYDRCIPLSPRLIDSLFDHQVNPVNDDSLLRLYRSVDADAAELNN